MNPPASLGRRLAPLDLTVFLHSSNTALPASGACSYQVVQYIGLLKQDVEGEEQAYGDYYTTPSGLQFPWYDGEGTGEWRTSIRAILLVGRTTSMLFCYLYEAGQPHIRCSRWWQMCHHFDTPCLVPSKT